MIERPAISFFAGQSNDEGFVDLANLPAADTGPVQANGNTAYIWDGSGWQVLQAGVNNLGNDWGPEIPFAWDWVRTRNEDLYIVKVADGGAGVDWASSRF